MNTEILGSLPLVVIWLALGAIGIVIQAFIKRDSSVVYGYYMATLAVTGILAATTLWSRGTAFNNMITLGGSAAFFDILFCIAGILAMLASKPYMQRMKAGFDEFYTIMVGSIAGMMLMAHAQNMLVMFIGLELMSVSFYVLAGFMRTSNRSVEASLKYFLLGAFASGFLVYGIALIYGATGSLQYGDIFTVVLGGTSQYPLLLAIGSVLLIVGLSFKIAAFPFHQWVPDVYEGAPTIVTSFMSTAGKAAAFSAILPAFTALMPMVKTAVLTPQLQLTLAIVSAVTMLVSNITAVVQKSVKRMLAFSSVAHAGYLLMGIVAGTADGHDAIMFYLTAYTFMQLGAFVVVSMLETNDETSLTFDAYAGLSKRNPPLAAAMAIFMFSLAGIPPLAGFFGKYLLFIAAIDAGFTWLTIVAVASSVISVWFYLGLVVKMYFQDAEHSAVQPPSGTSAVTVAVCTTATVVLGILPTLITNLLASW